MKDDRKMPLWPWIATLLFGLPLLYVATFGPACWVADRYRDSHPGFRSAAMSVYRPLAVITLWIPGDTRTPLVAYGEWRSPHFPSTTARILILTAMVENELVHRE
jgi:hypothetical protein